MQRAAWLILVVGALGCAGASSRASRGTAPSEREPFGGSANAPPSMQALPDVDVPESELTPKMRAGLGLAEEAFDVPAPPGPAATDVPTIEEWSRGPLAEWLQRKTRAVDEARRELDAAAGEQHRQRVMGGALVGLMYEDIANVILSIPTPRDFDDEPEIADAYRYVVRAQAATYLDQARRAFHACSLNAAQVEPLRRWSRFCAAREERLPTTHAEAPPPNGTTEVTVTVDE